MARIVKLKPIVPEDFIIEQPDGTQHLIAGDAPTELIVRIASLMDEKQDREMTDEDGVEIMDMINDEVVQLLRLRDPEIERNPFGPVGTQVLIAEIVSQWMQMAGVEADPPPKKPTAKKRSASRKTSPRSSGSSSR